MISGIRKIEKALGKEQVGFITEEEKIAKKLRGHIKVENSFDNIVERA